MWRPVVTLQYLVNRNSFSSSFDCHCKIFPLKRRLSLKNSWMNKGVSENFFTVPSFHRNFGWNRNVKVTSRTGRVWHISRYFCQLFVFWCLHVPSLYHSHVSLTRTHPYKHLSTFIILYHSNQTFFPLRFKDHFPHAYFMVTSIINIIF